MVASMSNLPCHAAVKWRIATTPISPSVEALLSEKEQRILADLRGAGDPMSGRAVARNLGIAPTTAISALKRLATAGLVSSR